MTAGGNMLSAMVEKKEKERKSKAPQVRVICLGSVRWGYEDPRKYLSPAHQLHCVAHCFPTRPWAGGNEL